MERPVWNTVLHGDGSVGDDGGGLHLRGLVLHLHRLHQPGLHSGVGESRGGSVVDEGGHMLHHGHGLADGVNKPVLVEILGETLQSKD